MKNHPFYSIRLCRLWGWGCSSMIVFLACMRPFVQFPVLQNINYVNFTWDLLIFFSIHVSISWYAYFIYNCKLKKSDAKSWIWISFGMIQGISRVFSYGFNLMKIFMVSFHFLYCCIPNIYVTKHMSLP
jgi:hypothetical protein